MGFFEECWCITIKSTAVVDNSSKRQFQANVLKDNHRIIASLAFIFVIIIVGVPMWWKTTEVYRVSLPYTGIENLSQNPIKIFGEIGIFTHDAIRTKLLVEELQTQFRDNDLLRLHFYQINLPPVVTSTAKTPSSLERKILEKYDLLPGNFIFYEWEKLKEDILVTSERSALIAKDTTSLKIQQVLRTWIYQEYILRQILENAKSAVSENKPKRTNNNAAPQYDVLISVLNPRPDLQNVEWDVRSASELYIQPFLDKINLISNYTIKSQWKYQVPLEFPSKQVKDNSKLGRHYALSEEHFPYIITSVEKKLGNPISDNACIHLVVYVQPCENGPLFIYDKLNQRISSNNVDSFISRNWGGVLIYNPTENVCLDYMNEPRRVTVPIRTDDVMQILLYQLRRLVDFETEVQIENADIIQLDDVTPRHWEIDRHYRNGIVYLISSTTLTLQSLIQLLGGISNIVINDEVGAAVNEAYENLLLTKQYLNENDIYNATFYAKKAFIASEVAFFHPSMLALLYFPDDQKYAIYIPLFLPIMIPVILSLKSIWNFYKPKNDVEKEKSE